MIRFMLETVDMLTLMCNFAKVGADLFQSGGKDYIIVVDYYSKYPEMAPFESKLHRVLFLHLKFILA